MEQSALEFQNKLSELGSTYSLTHHLQRYTLFTVIELCVVN
jgi:hypothetical protein